MTRQTQENIVTGVLACIFIGYIAVALGFGPNARLVPLPIAAVGLLCLLVQIVRQNLSGGLKGNTVNPLALLTGGSLTGDSEPESSTAPQRDVRRELVAFGFVGLFVGLIVALGPVPAVFLFCAGFLAISKHYAPWKAVALAGAFAVTVYLLFVIGLELQLYHGLLEPWVERF